MKKEQIDDKIDETIRAVKTSYPGKYSDKDYELFRTTARAEAKTLKQLVTLVENLFDLDRSDAHDMVH